MDDSKKRLIEAAVRPFSDNAEMRLSAADFLGQRGTANDDAAAAMLAHTPTALAAETSARASRHAALQQRGGAQLKEGDFNRNASRRSRMSTWDRDT